MFTLPDLPYGYDALEPFIDEETMHLHHDKHHQVYIDNLNKTLQNMSIDGAEIDKWMKMDVKDILRKLEDLPEEVRTKVRNNAGGHANHSFFWQIMAAPKGMTVLAPTPDGDLKAAIDKTFGNFGSFQEKFSNAALNRFGSGWAWLTSDLEVLDTPNQDTPLIDGKKAILGIDMWEHSFYLHYQNKKADYVKAWWNVVNWPKVEEFFKKANTPVY